MLGNSIFDETVIYRNNGTIFIPAVSIPLYASDIEVIDITDDGKWVLVVELIGKIDLIEFNEEKDAVTVYDFSYNHSNKTEAGAISDDH